jgi:hypothetical protein
MNNGVGYRTSISSVSPVPSSSRIKSLYWVNLCSNAVPSFGDAVRVEGAHCFNVVSLPVRVNFVSERPSFSKRGTGSIITGPYVFH